MKTDAYGQLIFNETDLCNLYMQDPDRTIKSVLIESDIKLTDMLDLSNMPDLVKYVKPTITVKEFDEQNQSHWYIPEEYLKMDIAQWVLDQCKGEAELQRAGEELIKFQERDMFVLLKYLKYLVDTMRKHNIVWGVGRGSSVASFVLFLISVHKINSLEYDLSIDEFLK